jgi:hypothetical protein
MHPKTFFDATPPKPQHGKCFVIMPFAKEFRPVFKTICEAIDDSSLNFICKRADDIRGGGNIMQDVLKGIGGSEIVIADLTRHNANVFYELGIAHMVKEVEKVIILIQETEKVPFDLTSFRHIKYIKGVRGAKRLKANIIAEITSITERAFKFNVKQNKVYKFPEMLKGAGGYMYSFEMVGYFGPNGADMELRVIRYAAGERGEELPVSKYGIGVGESKQVPKIPYDLKLERSSEGMGGSFRLFKR